MYESQWDNEVYMKLEKTVHKFQKYKPVYRCLGIGWSMDMWKARITKGHKETLGNNRCVNYCYLDICCEKFECAHIYKMYQIAQTIYKNIQIHK